MPQKPTIPRVCQVCGEDFLARGQAVKRGQANYCSYKCSHSAAKKPLADRFWSKVKKTDSCWLWTGYTGPTGYGCMGSGKPGNKIERVHRISYELHYGPIPDGLLVLHRCDVRNCVRPDHLFLGTQVDNIRDMIAKGRRGNRWESR